MGRIILTAFVCQATRLGGEIKVMDRQKHTKRPRALAKPAAVQSVSRALHVLSSFTQDSFDLSLDQLSAKLQVNKPSLHRVLKTLHEEGFLTWEEDKYSLAPKVLQLAHAYLRKLSVPDLAKSRITPIAEREHLTASVAILDGLSVVYVAIVQPRQELGVQDVIGARHPAHATALGKVMLASLDNQELKSRLSTQGLVRLTEKTIVDTERLMSCLEDVRRNGYAIDDEERGLGIRCIAAPLLNWEGRTIAAVSLAGATVNLTHERAVALSSELVKVADEISTVFGYQAHSPK